MSKYTKGNYIAVVEHSPKECAINLYIQNTKFGCGLIIPRSTKIGTEYHTTTHSNIFGATTETDKRGIYDEQKIFDELTELGKDIVDFLALCDCQKNLKGANPSEALECLKHIKKYYIPEPCSAKTYDCLETIKQALLKAQEQEKFFDDKLVFKDGAIMTGFDYKGKQLVAMPLEEYDEFMKQEKTQEPKQYLKWEDLEFDELEFKVEQKKDFKVKLNGTEYGLEIDITFGIKEALIFDINANCLYAVFHERHKQFFNDLHLERVEE